MLSSLILDNYLIKSTELKYLTLDGKYAVVTELGEKVMQTIMTDCVGIMIAGGDNVTAATKSYNERTGKNLTNNDITIMLLTELLGTKPRLMAFLLHEKETEFVSLKKQLEITKGKPNLSVVKKQQYDS